MQQKLKYSFSLVVLKLALLSLGPEGVSDRVFQGLGGLAVSTPDFWSLASLAVRLVVMLPSCRKTELSPASLLVSPKLSQILSFSSSFRPGTGCRCGVELAGPVDADAVWS